eukprot:TRINITY_DN49351_c0_g1_i1.p1 TRINITY_DN49351_c0_g1~~TRINITY_DN49351_c0_g1_i1.p1  ORF type:complete len:525 (-),score=107.42 TRINITY_DN49351_c0_g1_i1:96-1670(-)
MSSAGVMLKLALLGLVYPVGVEGRAPRTASASLVDDAPLEVPPQDAAAATPQDVALDGVPQAEAKANAAGPAEADVEVPAPKPRPLMRKEGQMDEGASVEDSNTSATRRDNHSQTETFEVSEKEEFEQLATLTTLTQVDVLADMLLDLDMLPDTESANSSTERSGDRHHHRRHALLKQLRNFITKDIVAWADKHTDSVDTSDKEEWPSLEPLAEHKGGREQWSSGLQEPHVYVISMASEGKRRASIANRFRNLRMKVGGVHWLPGVDASQMPAGLRNPNGKAASGLEQAFKMYPGKLGCILAHLMAYHKNLKRCPHCDVLVVEDDVAFHPRFRVKLAEFLSGLPSWIPQDPARAPKGWPAKAQAIEHQGSATDWISAYDESQLLPVARLHIGGDVFWAPPIRVMPTYYQASWPSRGWGYVVKANYTREIFEHLRATRQPDIDQQISGLDYLQKYAILAPKKPIVLGMKSKSATEFGPPATRSDYFKSMGDQDIEAAFEKACWHECPVVLGDCRSLPNQGKCFPG